MTHSPPPRRSSDLSPTLSQAFAHLLGNILGQAGCRHDTVLFRLHHAAPLFTKSAPAAKRRHKTGSRLRIELIERNNGVGHKPERKSTRLNSPHQCSSPIPSSA